MSETIDIMVNGERQTHAMGISLLNLVQHMQLTGKRIAVEHNRQVVPRSQYEKTILSADDTIEIVHAIGGG